MKSFLTALFSDSGNVSMVRVLSLICVLTASGIALYAVSKGTDLSGISILCGTFLGAGLGAKVAQKSMEVKNGDGA